MTAARSLPLGPASLFLVAAAGLCTVELALLAHPGFLVRPDLLATAATLDLVLGLPALGYLFLVRGGRARPWVMVPLFLLGVGLARWWVPSPRQGFLDSLEWVLVALELGLLSYLILRIRRIRKDYRAGVGEHLYPLDALRASVARSVGSRLPAEILVSELAILYYALTGWWKSPEPPTGESERPYSCHRRGAYPALLAAILLVTTVEVLVVHLLLALWIPWVAWVVTGLGIYGILWLLGDFQCMRLQPTVAAGSGLHLRVGLRWRVRVPWDAIRRLEPGAWEPPETGVRLTPFGTPDFWVELHDPVTVEGLFGIRRRTRFLGVGVEKPEELRAEVRRRSGDLSTTGD